MMPNPVSSAQKVWVELFFESQNERSNMPPSVIGLLETESPTHYALDKVQGEDADFQPTTQSGLCFFNKTYVWLCRVIGPTLPFVSSEDDYDTGGMG